MDDQNQPLDAGIQAGSSDFAALRVSDDVKQSLWEMSRWTNFISIFYFIIIGLGALGLLVAGGAMMSIGGAAAGGAAFGIFFALLLLGFALWIALALFRFSSKTKRGLQLADQSALEEGLRNMKLFWKVTGVMLVVVMVFYAIMIIGFGATSALRGF